MYFLSLPRVSHPQRERDINIVAGERIWRMARVFQMKSDNRECEMENGWSRPGRAQSRVAWRVLFVRPSLAPRSFLSRTPLFRAHTHATHPPTRSRSPGLRPALLRSLSFRLNKWADVFGTVHSARGRREERDRKSEREKPPTLAVAFACRRCAKRLPLRRRERRGPSRLGVASSERAERAPKGTKGIVVE